MVSISQLGLQMSTNQRYLLVVNKSGHVILFKLQPDSDRPTVMKTVICQRYVCVYYVILCAYMPFSEDIYLASVPGGHHKRGTR